MPNRFDAVHKAIFFEYVRAWLGLAGCPLPAGDGGLTVVDADLSTAVSATVDKLIRVDGVPVPYLVEVEFQSSGDAAFDLRMLLYNVLVRHKFGLPVLTIAFLFRPAAGYGASGGVADRVGDLGHLDFAYLVIRVWELDADALLRGDIGTLPLALVADVTRDRFPAAAAEVRRRLAAEVPANKARDMAAATWVMMGLKFGDDDDTTRSFMAMFSDLIEESTTYQAAVAKGRVEGRVEGRTEGEVIGAANAVLRRPIRRLGSPPPAWVVEQVRAAVAAGKTDAAEDRLDVIAGWDQFVAP